MKKKPAHHEDSRRTKKATATAKAGGTTVRPASPPRRVMAVREVPAGVFKDKCLELLDGVRDGRYEVLVTKHGKPTARIVAPEEPFVSGWGAMRGTLSYAADESLIEPELDVWKDYL